MATPLNLIQGVLHSNFTLPQQSACLRPASVDVSQVQGMDEFSLPGIPAMGYQVDLAEPGRGHVPTVGLDRDVVLQQTARLGAPLDPPFALALLRL